MSRKLLEIPSAYNRDFKTILLLAESRMMCKQNKWIDLKIDSPKNMRKKRSIHKLREFLFFIFENKFYRWVIISDLFQLKLHFINLFKLKYISLVGWMAEYYYRQQYEKKKKIRDMQCFLPLFMYGMKILSFVEWKMSSERCWTDNIYVWMALDYIIQAHISHSNSNNAQYNKKQFLQFLVFYHSCKLEFLFKKIPLPFSAKKLKNQN